MKEYKTFSDQKIPTTSHFIVRLDGMGFSKYIKSFGEPFDLNFIKTMVCTMNDLIEKFAARTGYCHSDEIMLIFSATDAQKKATHIYGGHIRKICSTIALFCSARFNYHLSKYIGSHKMVFFDARVLVTDSKAELVNYMIGTTHGIYGKKVMYTKICDGSEVQRTRIDNKCFRIVCNDLFQDLLLSKVWNDDDYQVFDI
jgi:tRNA(His) 5'-end guanylyltransferase